MNAKELRELRKKTGLTQGELAKLAGVSIKTISNYEAGEVIPVSKHELLREILSNKHVNEPGEKYQKMDKIENLQNEIKLKDEIILLLKEKIELLKNNN